jgi:hypothetical protein
VPSCRPWRRFSACHKRSKHSGQRPASRHCASGGKQARALAVSRSSVYYRPRLVSEADLALMRRIDELHMNFPFAGSRMLRDLLSLKGVAGGRRHLRFNS